MRERISNFITGFGEAWTLAKPYFSSEERWGAFLLLGAIIALNLIMVGMNVVLTYWQNLFFNAIQTYDATAAWHLLFLPLIYSKGHLAMAGLSELLVLYIIIAVYAFYLNQMLQIKWRQWLTTHYVENWLSDRAYYTISLSHDPGAVIDNPDQRISEDLRDFTTNTLSLGLDFISNVVTLFSFIFVLYAISGSITLFGVTINGYMVWVALLYSIFGTIITQLIGRKLVALSFSQQRLEANFRYSLMRVRENPEAIALSRGEWDEQATLGERFQAVRDNFWAIMRRTKLLNFFTIGFTQVANYFPFIAAMPQYFARKITLGGLTQISSVFPQVQGALSWFVNVYAQLVVWRATVSRLYGFREAMEAARLAAAGGPRLSEPGAALMLHGLTLTLPSGRKLLENASLSLPPGEKITVTGPSGAGKSTLFRAIAGIWPFGEGRITPPSGSLLFLPQKPYFPLGSLKRSITYPAPEDAVSDEAAVDALTALGLGHLAPRLHDTANWGLQLSGGEQQRLALARALVAAPDWLFLDEATSALDPPLAAQVQAALAKHLPNTTIVAISHHDGGGARRLHLANGALAEEAGATARA